MKAKINELEQFKDLHERIALQNESYCKRLNILIHGVENDEKLAWKSRDITTQKLKKFMKEELEMDVDEVPIVDLHRLPQQPLFR